MRRGVPYSEPFPEHKVCGGFFTMAVPRVPGLEGSWRLSQGSVSPALSNLGQVRPSPERRGPSWSHTSWGRAGGSLQGVWSSARVSLHDQLRNIAARAGAPGGGTGLPGVVCQVPTRGSLGRGGDRLHLRGGAASQLRMTAVWGPKLRLMASSDFSRGARHQDLFVCIQKFLYT